MRAASVIASALFATALAVGGCGGGNAAEPADTGPSPDELRALELAERIDELEDELDELERTEASQGPAKRARRTRGGLLRQADVAAFGELERRVGGEIGVALVPLGSRRVQTLGTAQTDVAWSTIKVALAAQLLTDVGGPGGLSGPQHAAVTHALKASDNAAAARIWDDLTRIHGSADGAAGAVEELLREAGDDETTVSTRGRDGFSPYGQTEWSLTQQARFVSALGRGCLLDGDSTGFLLDLMANVVTDQRWGLGAVGRSARFKGGWGPAPDGRYTVRQVGILEHANTSRGVVVAIIARPASGTFEAGKEAVTEVARWVERRIRRVPPPADC